MNRILALLGLILLSSHTPVGCNQPDNSAKTISGNNPSQILQPAKWTTSLSKENVIAGDVIEVILKATIDDKWYLYANEFDPDCGPLLTEIQFTDMKNFELVGALKA